MTQDRDDTGRTGPGDPRRPPGPLESLFQEAVRRATGLGLSGLATTEEAMRKAFQERAPREWLQFLTDQSGDLRNEIAQRIAAEVGAFLRSPEFEVKLRELLDTYEFSVSFKLRADPKPKTAAERRDPDET